MAAIFTWFGSPRQRRLGGGSFWSNALWDTSCLLLLISLSFISHPGVAHAGIITRTIRYMCRVNKHIYINYNVLQVKLFLMISVKVELLENTLGYFWFLVVMITSRLGRGRLAVRVLAVSLQALHLPRLQITEVLLS